MYASPFEYLHRDHLGSVDVITDATGVQRSDKLSFDAFGGRRQYTWAADITTASKTTILSNEDERFARGYTDHEQLNRTGFIHMNGRVYDPRIGRFVSADPIVQAPFHSQSYNRYSYVFNSPLSYTDPSRYFGGSASGLMGAPNVGRPTVCQSFVDSSVGSIVNRYLLSLHLNEAPNVAGPTPDTVPGAVDPAADLADFDKMPDQQLLDWIFNHAKELEIVFGPRVERVMATGKRYGLEPSLGRDSCDSQNGCETVQRPNDGCRYNVKEIYGEWDRRSAIRVNRKGFEPKSEHWYDDIAHQSRTDVYSRVEVAISVVAHEVAHSRGIEMSNPQGHHPLSDAAGRAAVNRFRKVYPK